MRAAVSPRSEGQRLLALFAAISMILSLMVVYAGPAGADGLDSPPECEAMAGNVDGGVVTANVDHVITAICIKSGENSFGDLSHSGVITTNGTHNGYVVSGLGTDQVTVSQGTAAHAVSHIDYTQVPDEPELDLATASVSGACVEESFVVNVSTSNATVGVDLDGDGTIEAGESGLTTGSHSVTAAASTEIAFQAEAGVGAAFDGEPPAGTILVLDCTEEPATGTLAIKKQANDDETGELAFNFNGPEGTFTLVDDETARFTVEVGTPHLITETDLPEGWVLDGIDCDAEGGTATELNLATRSVTMTVTEPDVVFRCVFDNEEPVNPPNTGILIVEKHAPDDPSAVFEFSIGGETFLLSDEDRVELRVALGVEVTVTEILPAPWRLESVRCDETGGSADIDLENLTVTMTVTGQQFECDFDNERQGGRVGHIVVVKEVTEGSDVEQSFTFNPVGFTLEDNTLSDGQQASATVSVEGTYSISETVPGGWQLVSAICDSTDEGDESTPQAIDLSAGEIVTCTFINDEIDDELEFGTVTIVKKADDDKTQGFTFTGDLSGSIAHDESITIDAQVGVAYSATEVVPAGWFLDKITCVSDGGQFAINETTASVSMTVTARGGSVTCTFDNEELGESEGAIVIRKQVTQGSNVEQSFAFTAVGFSLGEDNTLAHGEQVSVEVNPGDYSVSEVVPSGWQLVSSVCQSTDEGDESTPGSIDISENEVVTCIFTNQQLGGQPGPVTPPSPQVGSIDVSKTTGVTSVAFPGGNVTFTVLVTNPSSVNVTIETISDSAFGQVVPSTSAGVLSTNCAVPQTLSPGGSYTCLFTAFVSGNANTTHLNLVTVTGKDVSGNVVSDSDDAVVSIVVTDEVGGIVITPEAPVIPVPTVISDVEVEAEELPFTGMEADPLVGLAIMLFGTGVLLLRWAPRRDES